MKNLGIASFLTENAPGTSRIGNRSASHSMTWGYVWLSDCLTVLPQLCIIVSVQCTWVYPKVSALSCNEIYAYNNKNSLRSNIKGYGGKTH